MQSPTGSSPESKSLVPPILKTHLIALVGAVSFLLLNAPLPWLFGPLTSCLITAVLGFELKSYKPLGDGMRTILGVAVGAAVTPAFLSVPTLLHTRKIRKNQAVAVPVVIRLILQLNSTQRYSIEPIHLTNSMGFADNLVQTFIA